MTTTTNNLPIYWDSDYVLGSGVETRTKSGPLAKILMDGEIAGVQLIAPLPITREELLVIHDAQYIDGLINDENAELTRSIFASTGGVRDALDAMFVNGTSGSLSSGLHHAKRNRAEGYCFVNGLAFVALRAISKHGVEKVAVLDTDAHCGGGTFQLVGENEQVLLADVSCNSYDSWQPNSERHYLEIVRNASEYLDAVTRALDHLEGVDALIYNSGMDPFEDCDTGGMRGITREVLAERERLVAQWCEDTQTPAMFVLAGGYGGRNLDLDGVARLHLPTIKEFARIRITPKLKN
jgi:acetoin utilization deacetylase AcuC-like enzyme